jgi:hypothetical protein
MYSARTGKAYLGFRNVAERHPAYLYRLMSEGCFPIEPVVFGRTVQAIITTMKTTHRKMIADADTSTLQFGSSLNLSADSLRRNHYQLPE